MEKKSKTVAVPLDYIRGLIIAQRGRCAITGKPLDPQEVNADHIIPVSRTELSPSMGRDNIWLVHKKVNAMKGTMTYDELVEMARTILDHHGETKELIERIHNNEVRPVTKEDFDVWVEQNCSSDGRIIT